MSPRPDDVLLIEDDPDFRGLVASLLRGAGLNVREAETAEAGLAAFAAARPGLVLLDLNLPDGDGLSVCQTMRKTAPAGTLPILLCSVRSSIVGVGTALAAGADAYILKPYDEDELLARVKAALGRA